MPPYGTASTDAHDYAAFLASKRIAAEPAGFEVELAALNPMLFPFQRDSVCWALARGRAALFQECGLGKGPEALEWAYQVHEHTGGDVLILAPLAVSQQFAREGEKFGRPVTVCRTQADVRPGTNVVNYEMLDHIATDHFAGVVADECFPPGTLIDTPSGKKAIECFRIGDEIINAFGVDVVWDVHRREVHRAIKITVGGRAICSSPNHPYFTQRGWVCAQDLLPGDSLVSTAAAMCLVRGDLHPEISITADSTVLREILLSEMADESTGAQGEGAYGGSRKEAWREEACVVSIRKSQSASRNRACAPSESPNSARSTSEDLPYIASDGPQTFRAWWKRPWADQAAIDALGGTREWMGRGVCLVTGAIDSWLSIELQNRLSEYRAANRYRGGWDIASWPQEPGREEGCETTLARVDRLEVLEPGNPGLERFRDADGRIYFYDLSAVRHPSFSINGCLVHNSGILKSFMGKTKRALVERFAQTPYKLACTATPAPNDHMELGNQSEFLGIMPSNEMLTRWFINDSSTTGTYRLKRHAEADFWDWIASWALAMRRPSDLGYDDAGFALPELRMHQVDVPVDLTANRAEHLFRIPDLNATGLHREMRLTAPARAEVVAELVNSDSEPWVCWTNTNYGADELVKRIPGAIEVRGSESIETKEAKLLGFLDGRWRVLIAKPRMFGWGLNLQFCHKVAFVDLSYSFEAIYQAVRRCYRFGQTRPVDCYLVVAETEGPVLATIERKMTAHDRMLDAMTASTRRLQQREDLELARYQPGVPMALPEWLRSVA